MGFGERAGPGPVHAGGAVGSQVGVDEGVARAVGGRRVLPEARVENVAGAEVKVQPAGKSPGVGFVGGTLGDCTGGAGGHFVGGDDLLGEGSGGGYLRRRRHCGDARASEAANAGLLVRAEVEDFVLEDVAAGKAAPVVVNVGNLRARAIEIITRVEEAVGRKFKQLSMPLV